MTTRTSRAAVLAGLLGVLSLTLAACGADAAAGDSPTGARTASPTQDSMSGDSMTGDSMTGDSMSGDMMTGQFGAACSAVPADGEGSFDGMADDPVATAASNNPVLSTLVTAVGAAGLVDTLNGAQDITVFAPTNDAFAAVDPATLDAAMADPSGLLTTVLTYHVVGEALAPEELAGTHVTLQGGELTVAGSGEDFTVNGTASVVCGNVQTANATVYLIDGVLLPPS